MLLTLGKLNTHNDVFYIAKVDVIMSKVDRFMCKHLRRMEFLVSTVTENLLNVVVAPPCRMGPPRQKLPF